MAGNTARIDQASLRRQWDAYVPMASICSYWTITKDQLIRLRRVWSLELRLDRRRRHKPGAGEGLPAPDAFELAASESGLSLAPLIAARTTCVQQHWDDKTRHDRQVTKPTPFSLARVEVPEELRDLDREDS